MNNRSVALLFHYISKNGLWREPDSNRRPATAGHETRELPSALPRDL